MTKKKIDSQIVICGRGGQGVLFLTRLIDEVAVHQGNNVISSETHGMAMRGGSVASYIRIGDYASPLIRTGQADIILALTDSELQFNNHLLKKDTGTVFVNSPNKKNNAVNATRISKDLGSVVVANLVLLGYACKDDTFPFDFSTVKTVLKKISPPRFLDSNIEALTAGYQI